jgi:hypothetical protein
MEFTDFSEYKRIQCHSTVLVHTTSRKIQMLATWVAFYWSLRPERLVVDKCQPLPGKLYATQLRNFRKPQVVFSR